MRRCNAFTLIEMLLVVAIIVLLISMLLPSLRRGAGKANVCASNEKQIMTAGLFYSYDNRGYLPAGAGPGGGWSPTWDQLVLSHGVTLQTLLCPAQNEGTRHYWVNSNHINAFSSWGNKNQTGVMGLGFSARPNSMSNPSNTFAWMEMRWRYAGYADGGTSSPGAGWASIAWVYQDYFILQYQHDKRANFVYVDTHVGLHNQDEALIPDGAGGYTFEKVRRKK